ncbi:Acetolactate synthase large subunit [Fulvia fulva]|uniref:Acetolactate synthase large subunit n=1 Tax=Passalora fulva TaxID=5499 RepID=A0A9Q8PB35_PASFU|nr:Acetolactate synthase large subunit [Fulvia fulva]KAK4622657.1 Acetolactate synthase large subunit [Fulvia fulva]UJO19233.1 Acetolactate synthase large subunit [Fulvia fulva]
MTTAGHQYTVAALFLQVLAESGVDYLFTVLGSDHASIIEAYQQRQHEGKAWPKMLHFQHEFVAISAADGYARTTGKPQCVIVHVDVGTAALGQGLHNASSGRAPMLIFAGLAPFTLGGELPASRSEHVQWYQDVPNQASIVAPYARYVNEIKTEEHVRLMVKRALCMASTGSPGPAYLTAAREVLAAPARDDLLQSGAMTAQVPTCKLTGLPQDAVRTIGEALLLAERPLVITGYLGRNHAAVRHLVRLADLVGGLQVIDSELREMLFPARHSAWTSRTHGSAAAISEADVILVLDCDVPWIPVKAKPSTTARIFHIDIDPRKEKMQLFDISAEATFQAECEVALQQLYEWIRGHDSWHERSFLLNHRRQNLVEKHAEGIRALNARAAPRGDGTISIDHLSACLRRILPESTTYVHDAVTNTIPLCEQLRLDRPGSGLSKGGSGLGWAGGAAIGVKLALDKYDINDRPHLKERGTECDEESSSSLVCCVTGDGALMFGTPVSTFWAQHRLGTPFLTIVLNNGGWKATRSCVDDVHPDGIAAKTRDADWGIDLSHDQSDHVGVAIAASNHTLWGKKVTRSIELEEALLEARRIVLEEKRGAMLEVVIS